MSEQVEMGEKLKEQGVKRVAHSHGESWMQLALKGVKFCCKQKQYFTTDQIHAVLRAMKHLEEPKDKRVLGALMKRAHKLRWCVPTERMEKSRRPECHRRPLTVWKSLLFEE
jgi:hypothetical protein